MNPLTGLVAIVTGASAPRGIGQAIALRLAQDGGVVTITTSDQVIFYDLVQNQTVYGCFE